MCVYDVYIEEVVIEVEKKEREGEREGGREGERETHGRDKTLRPLTVFRARGGAEFALSHQLSLSSSGRLHQGAGSAGDVLCRLQNLFLKVQSLVGTLGGVGLA